MEERVELPMQVHRLLQVNQAASRETCARVLDKLASTPPAVGYSKVGERQSSFQQFKHSAVHPGTEAWCVQTAIASRERVLGEVGRSLEEGTKTSAGPRVAASVPYSDIPGAYGIGHSLFVGCLPLPNFGLEASAADDGSLAAGALALLHEAGDLQSVLSWGGAWLQEHPRHELASDVALSVALAHCDLAGVKMDSGRADVLSCVDEMRLADSLLQQYQAGPLLQRDIAKALQVRA